MLTHRYSRWDGTQRVFDAEYLLDAMSKDLMEHGDVVEALRELIRRGIESLKGQDLKGLQQMLEQARERRQQELEQASGQNASPDLEEMLRQLEQGRARLQLSMESVSTTQRQELNQSPDSLLDAETKEQLEELAEKLEELMPPDETRRRRRSLGTLEEALDLMRRLQDMDDVERSLQEAMQTGSTDNIDPEKLERVVGHEAKRDLEQLRQVAKRLEEEGYITRKGERLELTPKAIRKFGQMALKELYQRLKKDRIGGHEAHIRGTGGEHTGDTKTFEFGDSFDIHLVQTVMNAVLREGPGAPVQINLEDFEVHRTEHMSQAATVLLLDQSRSMGLFGTFLAAKKAALALFYLVQSQFPRDALYMIGFSDYAIEIKREELLRSSWNAWVSGTNMHHALMLSRKLLARHKVGTRQVIMITDGEPTAHLEGDQAYFTYPPSYRTIHETLKEVKRCTREGIIINTFMLESNYHLLDFVDRMTRINRGRALYTAPEHLGKYILVDYITHRRKHLS